MKELYKELLERFDNLTGLKQTETNDARIVELSLTIIRVQQILFRRLEIEKNKDKTPAV